MVTCMVLVYTCATWDRALSLSPRTWKLLSLSPGFRQSSFTANRPGIKLFQTVVIQHQSEILKIITWVQMVEDNWKAFIFPSAKGI